MAESTKLERFNAMINSEILKAWRGSITGNETKKERLEEALKDNTKKHEKNK